jgi:hypothetical protein
MWKDGNFESGEHALKYVVGMRRAQPCGCHGSVAGREIEASVEIEAEAISNGGIVDVNLGRLVVQLIKLASLSLLLHRFSYCNAF